MARRSRWLSVTVGAAIALSGCALLAGVDFDAATLGPKGAVEAGASAEDGSFEADARPGSCAPAEKICNGACVARDDPRFGCTAEDCAPCALPFVAEAKCEGGRCVPASCAAGRADCDHDAGNGCEADLTSSATCASCTVACSGATPSCVDAGCVTNCTGLLFNGNCYYTAGRLQSCDDVCAPFGGCDLAGTIAVGSGTPNDCPLVRGALGFLAGSTNNITGRTTGCLVDAFSGNGAVFTSPTTTCMGFEPATSGTSPIQRICACNRPATGGGAPCAIPDGGTIPHGAKTVAYAKPCTDPAADRELRVCHNGILSGSLDQPTCAP